MMEAAGTAMQASFRVAHEPVTLDLPAGEAKRFMLPIIDPVNPDVYVVNRAPVAIFLSFGPNAPVGPDAPECVVVGAGQVMTLTTKEDVIAGAETWLVQGGSQAQRAGFTMMATGWATKAGSVVIYRGEVSLVEATGPQAERAQQQVPATVWVAEKPAPQTSTRTAWPEGWPLVKAS